MNLTDVCVFLGQIRVQEKGYTSGPPDEKYNNLATVLEEAGYIRKEIIGKQIGRYILTGMRMAALGILSSVDEVLRKQINKNSIITYPSS